MAKLIYTLEDTVLGEYPLDKERVTIGRRPGNDIHVDNLAISGEHAVITNIGKDSFFEDLGSTNGTLINGKPVQRYVLQHGDVIELGKCKLKYISQPVGLAASGGTQTDFGTTSAAAEPLPARASSQEAGRAPYRPAVTKLQVLNGPGTGRELVLTRTLTTLGRPGVQVAVITRRPQGYFLTHVEGKGFPSINGTSIGAQARLLKDRDTLELAGIRMQFYFAPD
ncbi:Glycogen accumulation regulator GarA [Methylophilaceae bacterium]|nr:Glycogen accumulation regulator GarA [Methylophilaceae bacterium]